MAEKCEHHEVVVQTYDSLKEHVDYVEGSLLNRFKDSDKRMENLAEELVKQGKTHIETETYVKVLYGKFEDLTDELSEVVKTLNEYIVEMSTVRGELNNNTDFVKRNKDIVYEVVKWLVLLVLGYSLK